MRSHARLRPAVLRTAAPVLLLALLVPLLARAPVARAATFDLSDCNPDPLLNGAALVVALETANNNGADDMIVLGAGCIYRLNVVNNNLDGPTGLPAIRRDGEPPSALTIQGNGATIERAAGSPPFRLLYIDGGLFSRIPVALNNLTLRGGDPGASYGGAIVARYAGLTITGSTLADNTTADDGGAIFSMDSLGFISGSTFSGNSAARGGAIFFGADGGGRVTIINSTFSGNSAAEGGAIVNRADLMLAHVTIAGNGDTSLVSDGSTAVRNSIIAGGAGTLPDVMVPIGSEGSITSDGYNLVGVDDAAIFVGPGDSAGATGAPIDSRLAPLGGNGGPTLTRAPYTGSPAVDAIPVGLNGCGGDIPTDQRGEARPAGPQCDIGAYEGAVALPTAPEVAVFLGASSAGGTPLADGQAAPVDFGSTTVGAPVDRAFTIRNAGTADLTLGAPTLPSGFVLVGAFPAGPLAPGAEASFQVRLSAAAAGALAGGLSFANGDADESPFDIPLAGVVTVAPTPEVAVFLGASSAGGTPLADGQAAPVDFGSTTAGAPVDRAFTIRNAGTADLTLGAPTLPAGFALVGAFPAGPLAPGAEASFQVRLSAAAAGAFAGGLSFANSDADESPFDIPLVGVVAAPPPSGGSVFLPLLAAPRLQPDLVVTSVSVSPDQRAFTAGEPVVVTVVVTNRGTAPAQPFWVDLSVSPRRAPQINDLWHDICGISPCVGAAWGVSRELAPGESVTLTTTGGFDPRRTYWTGWLPGGTSMLYAYADSWNTVGSEGTVRESDETNNRGSLGGLVVTGTNPPAQPWVGPGLAGAPDLSALPARPSLR